MMTQKGTHTRNIIKMTCLENLVPQDHLVRKMDAALNLDFIYDLVQDTYSNDNGRPSIDPVVIVKIALIKKMFGLPSIRRTLSEIQLNLAYRWYIGYDLEEAVPHFTTYIKNYNQRFGGKELFANLFENILNTCLDNELIEPDVLFIDATHIKASANKNKLRDELVPITAKHYQEELEAEISEHRSKMGRKPLKKKKKWKKKRN